MAVFRWQGQRPDFRPPHELCRIFSVAGFTLIEMMVVVAIVAILAAMTAPSFNRFVVSSRVISATNDLVAALHLARSEAVTRNASVSLCPVSLPPGSGDACANSENWSGGWQVVAGNNVLRLWDAPGGSLSVSGPAGGIAYGNMGRSDAAQIEISLDGITRCVVVSLGGRVQANTGGCA